MLCILSMLSHDPHTVHKGRASDEQRVGGRVTVPKFVAMKAAGRKITMLTAYDFATARLVD